MGTFITLTRRELAGHFLSFRGYVILAGVQFLLGLSLLLIVDALNNQPFDLPITEKFPSTGLFWLVLLLVTPVITMRTFAREKSTGTFETLMTTPVSDLQVVLAKFSGAFGFYLLTFLPMAAFPFILKHYAAVFPEVDAGPVASTFLGIALVGSFFMALGCFASSLTRSQIVAAMASFTLGTGIFMVGLLGEISPPTDTPLYAALRYISVLEHMKDFSSGIIDSRHIVFYLSLTAVFLFLTCQTIGSRRWK